VTKTSPERVTVTIRSSAGDSELLTVADAMRQILDFFELLASAGGSDSQSVTWQLVEISMKSPLRATAQAVSKIPGVLAEPIARREKAALARSIHQVVNSEKFPDWMDLRSRESAKSLFERNTNGIGRTDIEFYEGSPPTIISQKTARDAVSHIERFEEEQKVKTEDLSRSEHGSIEAVMMDVTSHYGRPAIRVREWTTGDILVCVFSTELAQASGPQHTWSEAWSNRRLLLTGTLQFRKDGHLAQIRLDAFEVIDGKSLKFEDVAQPGFTGGLSPLDYIESWWEADFG